MSGIRRALSKIRTKHDGVVGDGDSGGSGSQSPRRSLVGFLRDRDDISSSDDLSDDSSSPMSKNQQKRLARQQARQAKSRLSEEQRSSSQQRRHEKEEEIAREETPEMKERYGDLPLVQSQTRSGEPKLRLADISTDLIGKEVTFVARLHIIRNMSAKLVFLVFRQQLTTFQGVLHAEEGKKSLGMVNWAERLRTGTIVRVRGIMQKPAVPVLGCTYHDVEISIEQLHVVVRREDSVPFSVYEAEIRTEEEDRVEGRFSHIPDRTRLSNRILDLRTGTAQAIFRIQSAVGNLWRAALDERGFIEIHTPKLQGSATESGASVFELNYFGRPAFLAQSPQLAKQMAIASDFERVYEIGAVFRAENSNTHRHLTEYTGLDIEMAIDEHYHEMLETIDAVLRHIITGIYSKYRREVEAVKHQFPSNDVVLAEKTPVIPFQEAVKLLNESGWRTEDGKEVPDDEDLATRDEIRLGEVVKEKYGTDYYIIDKFPVSARPFYTMPDANNPGYTNSFDIFVRGQEIVSGGQRIHDPSMLEDNMKKVGIKPSDMEDYLEGFRWGAPPHAGAGVGLERFVMLLLKLGNIRLASLFHRDPKSFPPKPPVLQLRHPEASTLEPTWQKEERGRKANDEKEYQPLVELIANYGDATSTSWTDDRYQIWRDPFTGAAVSYIPSYNYAIIPGDPLCDPSQYNRVISGFLHWLKRETKLKPIWILISPAVEELLGEKYGWRSLSCIAEERVDPSRNLMASDTEVARKIRHAESEGIKVIDVPHGELPSEEIRTKIDKRIKDWLANRKGTQIHLSEIAPWRDYEHRWYYYAIDKEGTVVAFVALAMLAPRQGMQVKYSLDFPDSPNGTIEYIVTHAIQTASKQGVKSLTFGAGATATLTPGHHMKGAKVRMLQHTYEAVAKQFHLTRKSEFRMKLGAHEEPLYIAYPPHGLGSRGIRAIMNFFED
ncbi:aspartyl-tRNA synthetase, cytoplasmic [Talaromyces stipitatus ATCC 10500]|uniref:Aspartate--tRNA ligase, cytoplasmic n=1 Tax=Talaromyces stipitatus (strain ATCC 10500 / CBS 375.48 / QM 6759 / NRRL 1006) TaxID=441959 RepID=B8MFQ8_TALSN|nr:aspartyl-tRNA synthetase, cytoplasmic [Talaromyces stipitatus ATCC 10500]EED17048.1 aspartyl-tRNA synthetase, cytoplasmic [Talaromyces stipitatus ATCC 10500]